MIRDAIAALTLFCHTVLGLERLHQQGFPMMLWDPYHNTHSSSKSLRAYRAITATGGFHTSLWCTLPGLCFWVSFGKSTFDGGLPRNQESGFWCQMSTFCFKLTSPLPRIILTTVFYFRYIKKPWSFFTYHKGSSWHNEDAKAIFWVIIEIFNYIMINTNTNI